MSNVHFRILPRLLMSAGVIVGPLAWPLPAFAHVKWFAPYIIGAPPQSVDKTLTNVWFWTGIALVLVFFAATRAVEKSPAGEIILGWMDRLTDPLWRRLDDFVRAVTSAFFIAIFAVGGVYLTPDLKTPAEWVSWAQLLIAAFAAQERWLGMFGSDLVKEFELDPFTLLVRTNCLY